MDRECNICSTDKWNIPFHPGKGKGKGKKGKKAKLDELELMYTGVNCAGNSCNMQSSKKSRVEGDPASANGVTIAVVGGETFTNINVGDTFTMTAVPHPATVITLTDPATGSVLSLVEFHSSCSQPLYHGDEFGSLRIVGFETNGGIVDEDKCNVPEICTTTAAPPTTEPSNPPCDACGGVQGSTVTMLRFQIVAGANTIEPNDQGGSATILGTAMPTGPIDDTADCYATMLNLKKPDPFQSTDVNDIYEIEYEGCAPFAAHLECTNEAGVVLQTKHNQFQSLKDIAGVPGTAWNTLGPADSTTPYITDGAYVIVHNNGAALGDQVTCRIKSPEHYCFAFPYDTEYLKYTHLDTTAPFYAQASTIFPGCAASRAEADTMEGCACVPEVQTEPQQNGDTCNAFICIPKGDEGNFETLNPAGAFDQTIQIDTACEAGGSKTLNIDDRFGMFKLIGFQKADGGNDLECDACPCNANNRKVCQGPSFDAFDTQSLVSKNVCDLEAPVAQNRFKCEGNGCVDQASEECTCGTVPGIGAKAQDYCMFAEGTLSPFLGAWEEFVDGAYVPVPAMNTDTAAVANNMPCCDHYWYTCAILQDSGDATTPRTGDFDFLGTTAEGNILAALENIGVDMDVVTQLDFGTPVDRGTACQVQIDPSQGFGDSSLVVIDESTNPAGVSSCYVDGTIDLYCNVPDTYVTSPLSADPQRKFCCLEPVGLLDAVTADLSVAECALPTSALSVPPPSSSLDVVSWFSNLIAAGDGAFGTDGTFAKGKVFGFGFGSCAVVFGVAVVAYAHQQSKLTERRHVTAHPSASTAENAAANGGVYDFESSCGDSAATDPAALPGGMAAAAAAVQAANLEWESEPAAAARVANSLLSGRNDTSAHITTAHAGEEDGEEEAEEENKDVSEEPAGLSRPQLSEGQSARSVTAII